MLIQGGPSEHISRVMRKRRKSLLLILCLVLFYFIGVGLFTWPFQLNYTTQFEYPYNGDVVSLISQWRDGRVPDVAPINSYVYHYDSEPRCSGATRLVFLVKSAPGNGDRRSAVRSTWGSRNPTFFLLGQHPGNAIENTDDIVRANFTDSYFNVTMKTMMGFDWVIRNCQAEYYVFVDDDYYVNPDIMQVLLSEKHPSRLYAGAVFHAAPIRELWSKWYIGLDEYPYDRWPPYINAGAYVLSKDALVDMYYASYYTKHFRFDDIFVSLLALKSAIKPTNFDGFTNKKVHINKDNYKHIVASHGYSPEELKAIWAQRLNF